jgi:hypothetical protein
VVLRGISAKAVDMVRSRGAVSSRHVCDHQTCEVHAVVWIVSDQG